MKNKRNRIKNYLKFGVFLFGISLLLWNCEKEDDNYKINHQTIIEAPILEEMSQKEKIDFLKVGIKSKILEYNNEKEVPNLFYKKYGEFDVKNVVTIKFPIMSNEFIVAIPFKQAPLKNNKLLIAYYKKGKRAYKFFNNSGYPNEINKSNRAFFLEYMPLLFRLTQQGENDRFTHRWECDPILLGEDYENCTQAWENPCTGFTWVISTIGKYEMCGGELDEVVIFADGGDDYGGYDVTSGGGTAGDNDIVTDPVDEDNWWDWDWNDTNGDPDVCSGGKVLNASGECVCPDGTVEGSDQNCFNLCEMAFIARDVQNINNGNQPTGTTPLPNQISGGWSLNSTLDLSQLNLSDSASGFNSAVYQKYENGEYKYMYVTEGTHDPQDLGTNFSQLWGGSDQYEISVANARILNNLVGSGSLYFVGHSLGGGLASANSLATGRDAFTYNAAGLSDPTRSLYDAGLNPFISATIVTGEFVDNIQSQFGLKAEGVINYIDYESSRWTEFLNFIIPGAFTYNEIRLHLINSVLSAMNCE